MQRIKEKSASGTLLKINWVLSQFFDSKQLFNVEKQNLSYKVHSQTNSGPSIIILFNDMLKKTYSTDLRRLSLHFLFLQNQYAHNHPSQTTPQPPKEHPAHLSGV